MANSRAALVGRREELSVIGDVLARLGDDGAGGVLQVAGDAGIGKTRLLDELRLQAQRRNCLVLSGRAAEFGGELPFGVFVDAVDDYVAGLAGESVKALAGRDATLLAVALPAFEPLAAGGLSVLVEERFRTHRAVRSLMSRLAEPHSVVLVLDDLHWADAGSIELLNHLLAYPPLGAVLLVVAFRPAQVAQQLDCSLADRLRRDGARRLDLAPLGRDEAHELLGTAVGGPLRDQLVEQSGGNPLFLEELARGAARPSAARRRTVGMTQNVPDAVLLVLESEIGSLSVSAQALLQGAAVAGDPFDEDLAAIAADIGADEALAAFDELLKSGIVNPSGSTRRFAFRHPLVRAAVYESGGRAWVVRAHGRVADALAKRGEPATVRAHHIERSASNGDELAVAALTEAGNMIASRAPATAAGWYRAGLRLLPASGQAASQRISLLFSLALASGNSGGLEDSVEAMDEVLGMLPPEEPFRAVVVAFGAAMEHLLGRHGQARDRLLDAYRALGDRDSREGVALMIELAAGCLYESAAHEGRSWAEQALAGSRALGDRPMEATAAALLSFAGFALGLPADPELSVATALADALDDNQLAGRLDLPLSLCWAQVQYERFDDAIALCERAVRVSRTTGQGAFLAGTMMAQGWGFMLCGRLAEAKTVFDSVIEAFRLSPNVFLCQAIGFAAWLAAWSGDNEAAMRLAEESLDLARLQEPGLIPAAAGASVAVVLMATDQVERAKAVILELCGGPEMTRLMRIGKVIDYEALTQADLAAGLADEARRWASFAAAAAHGGELPVESAFAARAQALVLAAAGEHGAAAEMAISAADRAEAAGSPVEAARCRIVAGRSLAQTGNRDQAVAMLEHAEEQLTRSGAFLFRDQAEKELCRLGRPVTVRSGPARSGKGPGGLTERERELAELVARGHTDRQIAASAYQQAAAASGAASTSLSPRECELLGLVGRGLTDKEIARDLVISLATVRSHLERIRDKTGRRRRPELTRLALDLGLTGE